MVSDCCLLSKTSKSQPLCCAVKWKHAQLPSRIWGPLYKPPWLWAYPTLQRHGLFDLPVAYYSSKLSPVVLGMPGCLRSVATAAIMIARSAPVVLASDCVVHVLHSVLTLPLHNTWRLHVVQVMSDHFVKDTHHCKTLTTSKSSHSLKFNMTVMQIPVPILFWSCILTALPLVRLITHKWLTVQ